MFISADKPALVLAPMDGVTDHLMRGVLSRGMPLSYAVTEFIRVSSNPLSSRVFFNDVPELKNGSRTDSGCPVQVQLLGGDVNLVAEAARTAVQLGARGIDLNFGCPAPTVNRHDGGATLLKFPERIEAIVRGVREVLPLDVPVSAKLRLGWDDPTAIHHNAERAARGGAAWITIHGRTKMQGYTPPAYWKPIGEVRRDLDIPVVANGEIWSVSDLLRCQDQSGCIHFMLGRGVLAEPGLTKALARELGLRCEDAHQDFCGSDINKWQPIILDLISVSRSAGESERRTLSRIKQWLNYACKRGNAPWFDQLKRIESIEEIERAVERLLRTCSL